MGDNSVEQLEQRVAELEATVRGLTDELVDTTERLRQLENGSQQQPEPPVTNENTESAQASQSGPTELDPTSNHPVQNSADDDGAPVNDDGTVETGEDETVEETDSGESGESDGSDDIIVA